MEGYVFEKRTDAGGLFNIAGSGKVFKRRWAVLQDEFLLYYDDIDLKRNVVKGDPKQRINVKGLIAIQVDETEMTYCVELSVRNQEFEENGRKVKGNNAKDKYRFACESQAFLDLWIAAINSAAVDYRSRYLKNNLALLNMKELTEDKLKSEDVSSAFRKAVLKSHPDKPGGSQEKFDAVKLAYEYCVRTISRRDEYNEITYTVILSKTPEAGVGLLVEEDTDTGETVMKGMHDKVKILSLSATAGGKLVDGDILTLIDKQDVSCWKLVRIKQRLSDFRVPVNSSISLQFKRYVLKEGVTATATNTSDVSQILSTDASSNATSTTINNNTMTGSVVTATNENTGTVDQNATYAGIVIPSNTSNSTEMTEASKLVALNEEKNRQFGAVNMNVTVALQRENAALQAQLHEMKEKYSALEENKKKQESTIEKYEARIIELTDALNESRQSTSYMKLLLEQHYCFGAGITSEDNRKHMRIIAGSCDDLKKDKKLATSSEAESLLESFGLGKQIEEQTPAYFTNNTRHQTPGGKKDQHYTDMDNINLKKTQRIAMTCASAIDPSGTMLKKWSVSGKSALDKLLKVEERLQQIEGTVPMGFTIYKPDEEGEDETKSESTRGDGDSEAGALGSDLKRANMAMKAKFASKNPLANVVKGRGFGKPGAMSNSGGGLGKKPGIGNDFGIKMVPNFENNTKQISDSSEGGLFREKKGGVTLGHGHRT